ncbi:helix-turn-helix transcriptional regulator [Marinospirillum insulare]|uniref:WYL domain-containing protein n=1 Tax=Marinospirillum insulare TaxID=217169 RepID=A0ABQ5ZTN5_9GAMM|nr:WYL domain-containing protein [Marinospirillum insulare]GLR62603.1 WYL domain-containing protein [Marinospirillum insulare]
MHNSKHKFFYWLIELLAYWEGRIQPSQLASITGVSRQQASKKLSEYRQNNLQALKFCNKQKAYLPTEKLLPSYITCEVGEYLRWITGQNIQYERALANTCLAPPMRPIAPELMRALLQALREQKRIEVNYVSISNPDHEGRIIVPYHLVNTGQRWHLRAWCEKNQDFRDFVLGRFQGKAELLNKSTISFLDDAAWHTHVSIIVAPDPRLSAEQRRVVEFEYAMQNGQLEIITRACLVSYKLQLLNINPRIYEAEATAQQLIIINKNDIKPWLFE